MQGSSLNLKRLVKKGKAHNRKRGIFLVCLSKYCHWINQIPSSVVLWANSCNPWDSTYTETFALSGAVECCGTAAADAVILDSLFPPRPVQVDPAAAAAPRGFRQRPALPARLRPQEPGRWGEPRAQPRAPCSPLPGLSTRGHPSSVPRCSCSKAAAQFGLRSSRGCSHSVGWAKWQHGSRDTKYVLFSFKWGLAAFLEETNVFGNYRSAIVENDNYSQMWGSCVQQTEINSRSIWLS